MPTRRSAAWLRPTRSSSASPRRSASAPMQAVQGRLEPDQLAPGHQRVERRLLERDADRAPHGRRPRSTTSWPATRRAAAGRAQQRGQHPHRGRLAGAVRAEERVDLALGDLEVDARDGLDPPRELALEPCYLDCRHGGGIYRRARSGLSYGAAGGTETRRSSASCSSLARCPAHEHRFAPALAALALAAWSRPSACSARRARRSRRNDRRRRSARPSARPSRRARRRPRCEAVGSVTGFQLVADGTRAPFKARQDGLDRRLGDRPLEAEEVAARTSSPTSIESNIFGMAPTARISVIKRQGRAQLQAQVAEPGGPPELVLGTRQTVHPHRPAEDPQGRVPRADDPDLGAAFAVNLSCDSNAVALEP